MGDSEKAVVFFVSGVLVVPSHSYLFKAKHWERLYKWIPVDYDMLFFSGTSEFVWRALSPPERMEKPSCSSPAKKVLGSPNFAKPFFFPSFLLE